MYGGESPNAKPFAMPNPAHPPLIERLREPARWLANPPSVELIETHISWVLLAGEEALKIKKPLDLGFLDFSTLERRRRFCEEELRINRRLAADYYKAVVPITGPADDPEFNGPGPATEYAVRMRRFQGPGLLSDHLDRMDEGLADRLAAQIAAFHTQAPAAAADSDYGTPEAVLRPMLENFRQLRDLIDDPEQLENVNRLEEWTRQRFQALKSLLQQRRDSGMIRECHGDLHLGNITLTETGPVIFDALEFDPALRWIDPISDLAFLTMDLEEKGHRRWAWQLLNTDLAQTGDYQGLGLLQFYQVYRAMVRAKVSAIRGRQEGLNDQQRREDRKACATYLRLAAGFAPAQPPFLLITQGLSGSGKSYAAKRLCRELPAVHLRSDVERKRLWPQPAAAPQGIAQGLYAPDKTAKTYARLLAVAEQILAQGISVCVDASFLAAARRKPFLNLAQTTGIPLGIVALQAPEAALRNRLRQRALAAKDPSDADEKVLENQLEKAEPLISAAEPPDLRREAPTTESGWQGLSDSIREPILGRSPRRPPVLIMLENPGPM